MSRSPTLWVEPGELLGHRWDPAYWDPGLRDPLARCAFPVAELGEFIPEGGIKYGRILPGRRPPEGDGPLYVTQRSIRPTGFDPGACVRIEEGCAWDTPQHRVLHNDLLLPRSGVGTLARGVMAVFQQDDSAVVDCFTDRVCLEGYSSTVVALFLRTPQGWLQIHRLINGVGPPNISFGEIRGLQVPLFPGPLVEAIEARHRRDQRAHLAHLARRESVRTAGRESTVDPHCSELARAASRELVAALAAVSAWVEGEALPG